MVFCCRYSNQWHYIRHRNRKESYQTWFGGKLRSHGARGHNNYFGTRNRGEPCDGWPRNGVQPVLLRSPWIEPGWGLLCVLSRAAHGDGPPSDGTRLSLFHNYTANLRRSLPAASDRAS